jgi:pimeloyl-ACP methyl ester carboxylesterase
MSETIESRADSGGVGLYVASVGSGPPIVFVHEFAGDHRNWLPQVRHLSPRHRCIVFNARGYPPSDVPDDVDDYGQARAVADIAAVLSHCGVDRAHVVGLSMGGYATLNFGIAHPDKVLSLTICGVGHGSDPATREEFLKNSAELAERMVALGMEKGTEAYANNPTRRRFRQKDPAAFAAFNRQFAEHSATGSSLTMRGYQLRRKTVYELQSDLRRIEAPTLIVTGDDDDPCIEPSLFMKRNIRGARLWIVPGSTHTVNLEEPAWFNDVVGRFIDDVDAGRWQP